MSIILLDYWSEKSLKIGQKTRGIKKNRRFIGITGKDV
jgi:hypothetical protein